MDISEQDYQKAVAVVMDCSSGSVSNLQRKLYWGYARAAAAIDRMQEEFIVSPMYPSGRRDVYPSDIHQLWKDLNAAQAVPEGFVLVEKCDIEMMLQLIDNSLGYKSAPNKDDTMKIVKNMLIRIGEANFEGGVLSGN